MTTSKHGKTSHPSDKDLRQNPGIGTSPGKNAAPTGVSIEGENTVEGDVENDTRSSGAIDPRQRGRENK